MTKTIIVKVWDKDNPKIFFEYELTQKNYANSKIADQLYKISNKQTDYIVQMDKESKNTSVEKLK